MKLVFILALIFSLSCYSNEIPEELLDDFGIEMEEDSDDSSSEEFDDEELAFDDIESDSEDSSTESSDEDLDLGSLDDDIELDEENDTPTKTVEELNKESFAKTLAELKEKTKIQKPLHTVLLKKGAYLEPVKEGLDEFISPRKAFVKIEYLNNQNPVVYIYNKEGNEIHFKTQASNIEPLKDDLDISSKPVQFNTYKPTKRWLEKNPSLDIDNRLYFHTHTYTPEYLEVISGLEETSASSARFEYQGFYNWNSPIDFGLSLSYESGTWSTDEFDGAWNSIYFGPIVKIEFPLSDELFVFANLSYQKSFVWNLLVDESGNRVRMANNLFDAGGGLKFKFSHFNLIGTVNYQSLSSHYKEGVFPLRKDFESGEMTALSLGIGVGIDLNL